MLFPQIVALDDFVDLLHAVIEGDLVRKIRGEHERFRSDALDGIGQSFFVAFAAAEELATFEIVHRFTFDAQPAVLQFSFQTVDDHGNPTGAAFQKADAQGWKFIQYPVDDHTRRRDSQRYRHPQRARGWKNCVGIKAQITITTTMYCQSTIEFGRFFIDRPKMSGAQVRV